MKLRYHASTNQAIVMAMFRTTASRPSGIITRQSRPDSPVFHDPRDVGMGFSGLGKIP
jgi:hypothetical protein